MSKFADPEFFAIVVEKARSQYATFVDVDSEAQARTMRQQFYNHRAWRRTQGFNNYDKISVMLSGKRVIFYHSQFGLTKAVKLVEGI